MGDAGFQPGALSRAYSASVRTSCSAPSPRRRCWPGTKRAGGESQAPAFTAHPRRAGGGGALAPPAAEAPAPTRSVLDFSGLAQCAELCWQLRGLAGRRQVPGAKVALQHNLGLGGAVVVTLYGMGFPGAAR